jgi:hypothetical protein
MLFMDVIDDGVEATSVFLEDDKDLELIVVAEEVDVEEDAIEATVVTNEVLLDVVDVEAF